MPPSGVITAALTGEEKHVTAQINRRMTVFLNSVCVIGVAFRAFRATAI